MKTIRNILLCSMLFSLCISSVAFAQEGMAVTGFDGKTAARYSYYYEDKSLAKNEWKQVWGNWYYFGEDNETKQNTWAEIDGKWYYFDQWSVMLSDTVTPDGYYVGSDGAWVEED